MGTEKNRRLLVCGLGAAAVAALVAFLLLGRGDGYLLHRGDLEAAKQHLRVRLELRTLEAVLAKDAEPVDPLRRAADEVRYAGLRLDHDMSRFVDVGDDDLQHGIRAGEDGRFIKDPRRDGARGTYGGQDDRMDVAEVRAEIAKETLPTGDGQTRVFWEKALECSEGVGAWMHEYSLGDGTTDVPLKTISLGEAKQLCDGQKFASQPQAALGTAFLVGSDTVVTAAHVFKGRELSRLRLVFDFVVTRPGENPSICRQVYEPQEVLAQVLGRGKHDWAVVRLDRDVEGGTVLQLAESSYADNVQSEAKVYIWGHSAGTPKKFVKGKVFRNRVGAPSIRVELDAFGGDSGAPLLNEDHEVVGVLYGGSTDWVDAGVCFEVAPAWIQHGGEFVTRMERFRPHLDG